MDKKIVILDYNMGNMFSVKNAFLSFGAETNISSDKEDVMNSDALIIPGVGAFGEAMENLKRMGLIAPILEYYNSGRPIMGICLGLQLLFEGSEEFGYNKGLGIIKGTVNKFNRTEGSRLKIPHMGWNKIHNSRTDKIWKDSPLKHVQGDGFMYFVHSYFVKPDDEGILLSTTEYSGTTFCSSIVTDNVFACQFHPEKSGHVGINIFKNWYESI
jgi:glutamine amidotransferase